MSMSQVQALFLRYFLGYLGVWMETTSPSWRLSRPLQRRGSTSEFLETGACLPRPVMSTGGGRANLGWISWARRPDTPSRGSRSFMASSAVAGGWPRSRYILGLGLLRCAAAVTRIIVALLSRDLFYECDKHHIFTQDPVIILTIDRSICPPTIDVNIHVFMFGVNLALCTFHTFSFISYYHRIFSSYENVNVCKKPEL